MPASPKKFSERTRNRLLLCLMRYYENNPQADGLPLIARDVPLDLAQMAGTLNGPRYDFGLKRLEALFLGMDDERRVLAHNLLSRGFSTMFPKLFNTPEGDRLLTDTAFLEQILQDRYPLAYTEYERWNAADPKQYFQDNFLTGSKLAFAGNVATAFLPYHFDKPFTAKALGKLAEAAGIFLEPGQVRA